MISVIDNAMINSPTGDSFSSRGNANPSARSSGSFAAMCTSQFSPPESNTIRPSTKAAASNLSPEPVSKTQPGTLNTRNLGKNPPTSTPTTALVAVLQVPVPAAPNIPLQAPANDSLADPLSLLTAAANAVSAPAQPPADASALAPSDATSSVMATSQPATSSPPQQQNDAHPDTDATANPQDLIPGSIIVAAQVADNTGPALRSIPQPVGSLGSPDTASSAHGTTNASLPAPQQSTIQSFPISDAPSSASASGDNTAPPKVLPQAFVSPTEIPPTNPQPRANQPPSPVTLPAVGTQESSVAATFHSSLHSLVIDALASSASESHQATNSSHVAPASSNAISTATRAQNVESNPISTNQDSTNQDSQPDTASARPPDPSQHKSTPVVAALGTGAAAGAPPAASAQVAAGAAPPATVPVVDPATQFPASQPTTPASAPKSDLPGSGSSPDTASNLPASGETPVTPPAGPVQMAQMVSKAAQSEMRIGMNTSAFGSVEVRTVVHANEVGVLIGSEKGDLRSLLSTELPGIANTLQQQNLRLNQVNFHQGFAFSNNQSSGGNPQPRSFTSRLIGKTGHAAELSSPESNEPAPLLSNRGGNGLSILA